MNNFPSQLQTFKKPNLSHLLIDFNHLDFSSNYLIHVLICITILWKYAENLAHPDFRSLKAKPWAQFLGISVGMRIGNWTDENVSISGSSWLLNRKHKCRLYWAEGENVEGSEPGCLWKTSARLQVREMPSSIYSGGIIHSQSCPVCGDKTKMILKNLLHMSFRAHKPLLNSQIGYQCFDNKWIPSSRGSCLVGQND